MHTGADPFGCDPQEALSIRSSLALLSVLVWIGYNSRTLGSNPFGCRVDARIRSIVQNWCRCETRLVFIIKYKGFLYAVGSVFSYPHYFGSDPYQWCHTGSVWIGSKREQIQNGSAPVYIKPQRAQQNVCTCVNRDLNKHAHKKCPRSEKLALSSLLRAFTLKIFSGPTMVGLIVNSEYKRMSSTLSVNSSLKINKMALLLTKNKFKIAFCSCLRTSILQNFSRPNHCGPYNRHWLSCMLKVFDSHAWPSCPYRYLNSQRTML